MAVDKPREGGDLREARRIAIDIVADCLGPSDRNTDLIEGIAEALVTAFDNGVLYQHDATFAGRRELLTKLLREHGIGIATLEELKARTLAIVRGELKPAQDDPKLWFSSIESLVESLKTIGGDHDDGELEIYEEWVRKARSDPMPERD